MRWERRLRQAGSLTELAEKPLLERRQRGTPGRQTGSLTDGAEQVFLKCPSFRLARRERRGRSGTRTHHAGRSLHLRRWLILNVRLRHA